MIAPMIVRMSVALHQRDNKVDQDSDTSSEIRTVDAALMLNEVGVVVADNVEHEQGGRGSEAPGDPELPLLRGKRTTTPLTRETSRDVRAASSSLVAIDADSSTTATDAPSEPTVVADGEHLDPPEMRVSKSSRFLRSERRHGVEQKESQFLDRPLRNQDLYGRALVPADDVDLDHLTEEQTSDRTRPASSGSGSDSDPRRPAAAEGPDQVQAPRRGVVLEADQTTENRRKIDEQYKNSQHQDLVVPSDLSRRSSLSSLVVTKSGTRRTTGMNVCVPKTDYPDSFNGCWVNYQDAGTCAAANYNHMPAGTCHYIDEDDRWRLLWYRCYSYALLANPDPTKKFGNSDYNLCRTSCIDFFTACFKNTTSGASPPPDLDPVNFFSTDETEPSPILCKNFRTSPWSFC